MVVGEAGAGREDRNYKGHEKPLGDDEYVHYLDHGDVFMQVHVCQNFHCVCQLYLSKSF